MNRDIRETIISEAEALFIEQGYSNTSMREIAKACSISVGNLCYHFPKKEDLMMFFHNRLLCQFLSQLPADIYDGDPWVGYFAVEYGFAHSLIFTPHILRLYMDVINNPVLRQEYYNKHDEIFNNFIADSDLIEDPLNIYPSTIAMCSLEFNLLEQLPNIEGGLDFDETMTRIFFTRLLFLRLQPEDFTDRIKRAIEIGNALHFDF